MNKLITKRIRAIEAELVCVNDYIRGDTFGTDTIQEAEERRNELEAKLDLAMKMSPEEIIRDVMPAEVATEMLCEPLARLSNRMRKNCLDARATYYTSVRERSPGAVKLARRLNTAKLAQLGRWLRRAASRIAGNAKQLSRLSGLSDPQSEMIRQVLNVRGINLAIARAALRAEIDSRNAKLV